MPKIKHFVSPLKEVWIPLLLLHFRLWYLKSPKRALRINLWIFRPSFCEHKPRLHSERVWDASTPKSLIREHIKKTPNNLVSFFLYSYCRWVTLFWFFHAHSKLAFIRHPSLSHWGKIIPKLPQKRQKHRQQMFSVADQQLLKAKVSAILSKHKRQIWACSCFSDIAVLPQVLGVW